MLAGVKNEVNITHIPQGEAPQLRGFPSTSLNPGTPLGGCGIPPPPGGPPDAHMRPGGPCEPSYIESYDWTSDLVQQVQY